MTFERFLMHRKGIQLNVDEGQRLDRAVSDLRDLPSRTTVLRAGEQVSCSTLLLEGFMCRYIDDRQGLRQLVAVHVPGDFVDLHAFPLKVLEHDVASITSVRVALVPHSELETIIAGSPAIARTLWFATLLDAAIHRVWLFRLGRLDAVGRVAHFLCEINARLMAAGLSDGQRFTLDLTQADLAEICGLTAIHVNRVLRHLREDNLCVFRSSQVEIIDPARLARRGQFDPDYLYIDPDALPPAYTRPANTRCVS